MEHQEQLDEVADARLGLRVAVALTGYSVSKLRPFYFALAGSVGEKNIDAWLIGVVDLPRVRLDLVTLAAEAVSVPRRVRLPAPNVECPPAALRLG